MVRILTTIKDILYEKGKKAETMEQLTKDVKKKSAMERRDAYFNYFNCVLLSRRFISITSHLQKKNKDHRESHNNIKIEPNRRRKNTETHTQRCLAIQNVKKKKINRQKFLCRVAEAQKTLDRSLLSAPHT